MTQSSIRSQEFREYLKFFDADDCRCGEGEVHSHCVVIDCGARIPRGEKLCSLCSQRKEPMRGSRRHFDGCKHVYFESSYKEPDQRWRQLGFCCEKCLAGWLDATLEGIGVPARYRECSLGNFTANTSPLRAKVEFLQGWVQSDLTTGLYLFGSVGSGKSHLLAGAIRALAERDVVGRYTNGRQFALRCQSSFSKNETVESIMDELLEGQYLAIDDLCSEKTTEFVRQSSLELIDRAYTSLTPLIVTSNLDLDQVARIEPRIASRLAEMCDLLEFREADYRVHLARDRAKPRNIKTS